MPPTSLKNLSLSPAAMDLGFSQTTDALTQQLQQQDEQRKKKIMAAGGGFDSPAANMLLGQTGGLNGS